MEGASKKQKRRFKAMQSRVQEQQKQMHSKRYLFVHPDQSWPRPPANFLSMEVSGSKKNGQKILSFKKSPEYEFLQHEFK